MRIFLCILCLHVSLLASSIALSDAQKAYLDQKGVITMCVDPEWEPFEKINEKGEHVGIVADLIGLVSHRLGVSIQLIPTKTWQETIQKSQERACDIVSIVNQTPKRDVWLNYTAPIIEDKAVLIAREEHDAITNLSLLNNHTIALLKDTSVLERVEKAYPNITIIPVISEEEAFALVENKKADLTLRSLIVSAYTIHKENFLNLKIVGEVPEYNNLLRIGVRNNDAMLRDILDMGVRSITKEEREQIIRKYVVLTLKTHSKNLYWLIYSVVALVFVLMLIGYVNYRLRKKIDKEVQKNLAQSKQAELGALMANISHQWRDNLTKISYINLGLRAHILQNKEISHELLDKSTQDIEQTIDFMSETMQNFLDYYKPSTNVQEFDVQDSINAVLNILDARIKKQNLEVIWHIHDAALVLGIRNEWMQVWMNLLSNTLNVAQKRSIYNPCVNITIDEKSIAFEDNCGGIEPSILKDLARNVHSGLGLKMCKDIIKKYEKSLHVSNARKGALVVIAL